MHYFRFKAALQKNSWITPAYIGVDEHGIIKSLSDHAPAEGAGIEIVNGIALPGWMNGHSHAFQYAMAGLAEQHPHNTPDDFWTWREAMYQCALSVDPDQAEAIAAMLYAEMMRYGYTHVAEFHYLHHDKNGKPYANLAEMGERMVSAAATAGISITLVPVFYQKGGFNLPPQERQRRFISLTTDDYFNLLNASAGVIKNYPDARLGFSVHSLRAVDFNDIVRTFGQGPADLPFHIHVAEQQKEITDCIAACGQRPLEWLMENLTVNERFHLVHATHLDDSELMALAASGATVVLCPSTEGNLGDGIFRMKEFVQRGGRWTIGTDSHIGLNPLEELRMVDYRQRLLTHQRNTFPGNSAQYMTSEAIERGRLAMGIHYKDHFVTEQPFDAVVYDAASPLLETTSRNNWLSTLIFAAGAGETLGTICKGKWRVRNGKHLQYESIKTKFVKALKSISMR